MYIEKCDSCGWNHKDIAVKESYPNVQYYVCPMTQEIVSYNLVLKAIREAVKSVRENALKGGEKE